MAAFNRRVKFVNVYDQRTCLHLSSLFAEIGISKHEARNNLWVFAGLCLSR